MHNTPVWLITGCSTGFGRELTKELLSQGKRVVVTARDTSKVEDLVKNYQDQAIIVQLDVTDPVQAEEAVKKSIEAFGQIDVLVNNAGFGYLGAVEESEEKPVREMFETNFFGAARMIHVTLPIMREQKRGVIINISSIGGIIGVPSLGYYNATKFALEGLSEALAKETAPLGIKVIIVEPSGFRTDWAGRSILESPKQIKEYAATSGAVKNSIKNNHGKQPGNPILAAKAMINAAESENPPLHLLLGKDALKGATKKLETFKANIDAWEVVSASVDAPA